MIKRNLMAILSVVLTIVIVGLSSVNGIAQALGDTKPKAVEGDEKAAAAHQSVLKAQAEAEIGLLSIKLFTSHGDARKEIVDQLVATGDKSLIPTFALAMRWSGESIYIQEGMSQLTGAKITTWHEAFEWQEAHPEIVPHPSYKPIKLGFLNNIDPRFMQFLVGPGTNRDEMKIRLEEITWGGVRVDGIPSLDNPKLVAANHEEAAYLVDDDLVFAVSINGDHRAYPLRIMGWHEMFNDVIGGVPVALAYCTLCGSGILFETLLNEDADPLVFGSSGFLYRSNKLMFDRGSKSLWNQFTGKPVSGKLVDSGIELKQRPVEILRWGDWRKRHPDTRVITLGTGFLRDYSSDAVYNEYFSSPDLMFPARVDNEDYAKRKDYVFGVREFGAAKAWPLVAFENAPVINDVIGATDVVLIGDPLQRSVRAYERRGEVFTAGEGDMLKTEGSTWDVTEEALVSADGRKLLRVAGHIAYWFAWSNYLGPETELYEG